MQFLSFSGSAFPFIILSQMLLVYHTGLYEATDRFFRTALSQKVMKKNKFSFSSLILLNLKKSASKDIMKAKSAFLVF